MNSIKTVISTFLFVLINLSSLTHASSNAWLQHTQISLHEDIAIDNLRPFYDDSPFVWLINNQLTAHTFDAIDFIAAANHHGLNREDYHYSTIKQLDPSQDESSAQLFDLLITDGLLKLIKHIHNGRLNPQVADPDWFIQRSNLNANEFLQQALLKRHLKTELNTLIPASVEYEKLSQALIRYQNYVEKGGWQTIPKTPLLRPGDRHQNIIFIQQRLAAEDSFFAATHKVPSQHYDSLMEQAVKRFQKKYSLKVDGIIGSETQYEMNISAPQRLQQIKVALERQRWLPDSLGQRYLMINLANFTLNAFDNQHKTLDMKVIVGSKSRQTPSFASELKHLVFNPYWNVPKKLARLDLLPKQQDNLNYFYQHDIRVFSTENGQRTEHDPYTIDWQSVSQRRFPYFLRQDPGDENALGKIKFLFPNKWSIYLHDTPDKDLFNEHKRSFSSGCIRVEDPLALAEFSLAKPNAQQTINAILDSKENKGKKLSRPLAIYVIYSTVSVSQNELTFHPDVYQRDKRIAELL